MPEKTIKAQCSCKERQEYFPITSVSRADLVGLGYDTTNVDDDMMHELSQDMAGEYLDYAFWADLRYFAEDRGIPKRKSE